MKKNIRKSPKKGLKSLLGKLKGSVLKHRVLTTIMAALVIFVLGFSLNSFRQGETVSLRGAAPAEQVSLKDAILANNDAINAIVQKINNLEKQVQDANSVVNGVRSAICGAE